jgi:hypothetical protein
MTVCACEYQSAYFSATGAMLLEEERALTAIGSLSLQFDH